MPGRTAPLDRSGSSARAWYNRPSEGFAPRACGDAQGRRRRAPRSGHGVLGRRLRELSASSSGHPRAREAPSCEIFIDHPLVSRRHASLIFEESSVKIVDLGSQNGTTLAGRRLQPNIPVAVPDGAAVAMGPATMTIRRGLLDSLPLD